MNRTKGTIPMVVGTVKVSMLWTRLATQKQAQKRTKQNKNPTNQQIKGLGRRGVSVGRRETEEENWSTYLMDSLTKSQQDFWLKMTAVSWNLKGSTIAKIILKKKTIYTILNQNSLLSYSIQDQIVLA